MTILPGSREISAKVGEGGMGEVYRYHDATKHHFGRFARSLGYLDWATQPDPFRRFADAPAFPLYPAPEAGTKRYAPASTTFDRTRQSKVEPPGEVSAAAVGDLLRHALGLSAWKQYQSSRWALRVNPSSGNLHPTEAYVITGSLAGLADRPAVYHYSADRHLLELRCLFDEGAWTSTWAGRPDVMLVALTSIHWREAWKYGERAFRYCQHDLGHAIAAVSIAAGLLGWRAALLPEWSHRDIAAAAGLDRAEDFADAEQEEPGCIMAVRPGGPSALSQMAIQDLVGAISRGHWTGRANRLSRDHAEWPIIDEVAHATEDPGRRSLAPMAPIERAVPILRAHPDRQIDARALLLQRRSAVAFDGRTTIDRPSFVEMLLSVMPSAATPWLAPWWTPRVHLALFVHRVDNLASGLYLLLRDSETLGRLQAACRTDFLWDRTDDDLPLWCLARGDARALAARVSCDQEIASDGFFSLGMVCDFEASLRTYGPSFYRHLFWETGMVGQVLYLEAEAAGERATGIGCFYDDPVHDLLGLRGHEFQSLYHFTVGRPIEDTRLTTEPGYAWEPPHD